MKTGELNVEVVDGRAWLYLTRSFGDRERLGRPDTPVHGIPLHAILRWVIEQINLGCWTPRFDENGNAIGLEIGKYSDEDFDVVEDDGDTAAKQALENGVKRQMAVILAGLFARARESGTDPKSEALIEQARQSAIENPPTGQTLSKEIHDYHPTNAWWNTEMHYAFRLIDILARLRDRMFVFTAPPIHGVLPPAIAHQLAEATRAYFYGLNSPAIAMSRAIVEAALQDRIDPGGQAQIPIGRMIDLAHERSVLTELGKDSAHQIRRLGNDIMHPKRGRKATDFEAMETLRKVRVVLDDLCA